MKRIFSLLLLLTLLSVTVSCDFAGQSAHTHEYGEWTVEKEATYAEAGLRVRTCECGERETEAIAAPNGAIVTDLLVRDGTLYVLGFQKTDGATNAYMNYVWSLDEDDSFTEIRRFTSEGAYALSLEKDSEFFYVGLGGPTTHVTDGVTSVGDIVRLAIRPILP